MQYILYNTNTHTCLNMTDDYNIHFNKTFHMTIMTVTIIHLK